MFRRNKAISLLVAAASVISIVPAMATDKLGNKTGYINEAYALKNGGYLYEGYKGSTNPEGIYYSIGTKTDKLVENLDKAWISGLYDSSYAIAKDYKNEYLINLASGEVVDSTPEEKFGILSNKLKKALKKTSRYAGDVYIDTNYISNNECSNDLVKLGGNRYSDVWYQYSATVTTGAATTVTTGAAVQTEANVVNDNKLYGYTDGNGKYIDVCNSANIYAYSSELNKMVKIDKFSSIDDDYNKDNKLQARLVEKPEYLAQDENYIYQKVNVDLYDYSENAKIVKGDATLALNFKNSLPEPNSYMDNYKPANGVYSLAYLTLKSDSDIENIEDGTVYVFDGRKYTYTKTKNQASDYDSSKGTGTIYFWDQQSLLNAILGDGNDGDIDKNKDTNFKYIVGPSAINNYKKDEITGKYYEVQPGAGDYILGAYAKYYDSSGNLTQEVSGSSYFGGFYAYLPKIYVNSTDNKITLSGKSTSAITFVQGTDKTSSPFASTDRTAEYGNFRINGDDTVNGDSKWTAVNNAFVYMYTKGASETSPATLWRGASSSYIKIVDTSGNNIGNIKYNNSSTSTSGALTGGSQLIAFNPDVFTKGQAFTLGDLTFKYNPLATSSDKMQYNSLSDLKNKLDIAISNYTKDGKYGASAFTGIDGCVYKDGIFTFDAEQAKIDKINLNFATDISDGRASITDETTKYISSVYPTHHTYIQKISKAQGKQVDMAYIPQTVDSYELDNKEVYASEEASEAFEAFQNSFNQYTVVNGKLQILCLDGDVKVTSLKLARDKVKFNDGKVLGNKYNANQVLDTCLVEKESDDKIDVDSDKGSAVIDIDSYGNVWVMNYGSIYEFVTDKFVKKYSCSTSLDKLSVYDANSLIAWQSDSNIYTTVYEGKEQSKANAAKAISAASGGTATTASMINNTTTIAQYGWNKTNNGTWNFYDSTGKMIANKWCNDDGKWYFLKEDGTMATGWLNSNSKWYYLGSDGAMKTGWLNDKGNWYFINPLGDMATGWINDGFNWYYLNQSGAMISNAIVDGYKLGMSGAWNG